MRLRALLLLAPLALCLLVTTGCSPGDAFGQSFGRSASGHAQLADHGIYGDGSDGALDLNGTNTYGFLSKSGSVYTFTRDLYPTTLTIRAGATLETAGYRGPFCKTTLTIESTGRLQNVGGNASGGTAGTAAPGVVLAAAGGGGLGSLFTGNPGTSTSAALGGAGGAGGTGDGGINAGGVGGSATALPANNGGVRALPWALIGFAASAGGGTAVTWYAIQPGAGGGSGGGDGTNFSGAGGGGGGALIAAAKALSLAGAGAIRVDGGAGGNSSGGNAGGGGGGGGGAAWVSYGSRKGAGTVTAAGGAPGTKTGTGSNGVAGSSGTVIELVN